jgi:hypothetical protein
MLTMYAVDKEYAKDGHGEQAKGKGKEASAEAEK